MEKINIIDVSSYQKFPNWDFIKKQCPNLTGVYVKASEGVNAPDSGFEKRATDVVNSGLQLGFYHFATLNNADVVADAKAEAAYFLKITAKFKTSLPFALDIEVPKHTLKPEQVQLYISTFLDALKAAGKDYCLYSYQPWLDANLPKTHPFGTVKLWLESYTTKYKTPKGWVNTWLWQYTGSGVITNVIGKFDLNKKV